MGTGRSDSVLVAGARLRERPGAADSVGKIVYGDCKGEFGRMNVDTGQEQKFWINPQQRYGKLPQDMMFRFVRQAPIEIDAHNPNIVYHGSQYVHKTIDGGVHWTKFSPDVTANGPEGHVMSGEPITRDMTGEEVYAALYSMRSSRLEPGVFWTGSNDGPVWMTRDNGKTWKNVTPAGLPPGGRVHTIEDSPHRKGSAYVSVYRMYLNDFKPYLYMTNDYGAHWTLLTDGTNGIPADQPMHVVREDPEQEGLLYAGTLQGAYVSFDQGKHWQTLQQNLPATPVTDFKVHHGDLLASTMGRAFWILDDVAPLRQIAASVTKTDADEPQRRAGSAWAGERSVRLQAAGDVALASMQTPAAAPKSCVRSRAVVQGVRPAIKPFDGSNVFLFTPAPAYRMHYQPLIGRPDQPEYPAAGARIDYYLASPSGEVKLEILDAAGTVVRSYSSEARAAAGGVARRRPARRRSAVDAADQSRHEPVRVGSPLSRRRGCRRLTAKAAASAAAARSSRPACSRRGSPPAASTRTEIVHREDRSADREGRRHRRGSRRADEVLAEGARRAGRGARGSGARAAGDRRRSAAIRRSCRASGIA